MSEITSQQKLETFFHRKIILYRSLLDCLKEERENLIHLDLNGLWRISKVKDDLCAGIASISRQIGALITTGKDRQLPSSSEIMATLPAEKKEGFKRLFHTVSVLKSEVEAYRKENVHVIDDSLEFIDELIMNITGSMGTREVYNHRCQFKKTRHQTLLRREA